jgi:hypothetical protein
MIYPSQIVQQDIQRHSKTYSFFFSASLFVSASISSIGFVGGVVAIVQLIHAPMAITAMKAMKTGDG